MRFPDFRRRRSTQEVVSVVPLAAPAAAAPSEAPVPAVEVTIVSSTPVVATVAAPPPPAPVPEPPAATPTPEAAPPPVPQTQAAAAPTGPDPNDAAPSRTGDNTDTAPEDNDDGPPGSLGQMPPVPDGSSVPTLLSELLRAFTDAAFQATEAVRAQHINDIQTLYEPSPEQNSDVWLPKTVKLGITPFVLPAEGPVPPLEVPLAAMIQPDPLIIDEMTFDFECNILQVQAVEAASPEEPPPPSRIAVSLLRDTDKGFPLRISVRFKAGQAPQVAARLNEALLRGVQ